MAENTDLWVIETALLTFNLGFVRLQAMKRFLTFVFFILAFSLTSVFVYTANSQRVSHDEKPSSTIDLLFERIRKDIVGDDEMKEGLRKDFKIFKDFRESNRKHHVKISSHIDFDTLGTVSMPKKWRDKFWGSKPDEKKALVGLLRALIEEIVYPRAKDFLKKNAVKYRETKFDKNNQTAEVSYRVEYKKKSGEVETLPLMFRLSRERTSWKIVDIFLEDQLWSDMFKNQFNHIISTKSYLVLIEKMKQKLDNVQSGKAF